MRNYWSCNNTCMNRNNREHHNTLLKCLRNTFSGRHLIVRMLYNVLYWKRAARKSYLYLIASLLIFPLLYVSVNHFISVWCHVAACTWFSIVFYCDNKELFPLVIIYFFLNLVKNYCYIIQNYYLDGMIGRVIYLLTLQHV